MGRCTERPRNARLGDSPDTETVAGLWSRDGQTTPAIACSSPMTASPDDLYGQSPFISNCIMHSTSGCCNGWHRHGLPLFGLLLQYIRTAVGIAQVPVGGREGVSIYLLTSVDVEH